MSALTILNTSILTTYGSFSYKEISLVEAKEMVRGGFQSAIGHESSAEIISTLLGIDCPMNRITFSQEVGGEALVFKLKSRPPEGVILTLPELEEIGYTWGLLTRTA